MNKGVSARNVSLSIGQSPNYINVIENGKTYPSMEMFFYICDYLGVTPKEFFDTESIDPVKTKELLETAKTLSKEQLDILVRLVKELRK